MMVVRENPGQVARKYLDLPDISLLHETLLKIEIGDLLVGWIVGAVTPNSKTYRSHKSSVRLVAQSPHIKSFTMYYEKDRRKPSGIQKIVTAGCPRGLSGSQNRDMRGRLN
jgi:hypothetical protein